MFHSDTFVDSRPNLPERLIPQVSVICLRALFRIRTQPEGSSYLNTLTHQNLLFSRVPINSILGFIIRTDKKVGFGRLR